MPPLVKQLGALNDVQLMSQALRNAGVQHVRALAGNVPLRRFVDEAREIALQSRCGDTLVLHFSGLGKTRDGRRLELAFSDHLEDEPMTGERPVDARSTERDPAAQAANGSLDGSELLVFFNWLRDRGVNVVSIIDGCDSALLAGLSTDDAAAQSRWLWRPWDKPLAEGAKTDRGAFFGLFAPSPTFEERLPAGSIEAKTFGIWSFVVAQALLSEGGRARFRDMAATAMKVFDTNRQSGSPARQYTGSPAIEASHPDRPMLATGLPGQDSTTVRGRDDRRIEITNPALQRGATATSGDSILLQGRVFAPTRATQIDANGVSGQLNPDGTFSIKLPLKAGENRVAVVAWFGNVDFVPLWLTLMNQPGRTLTKSGRSYAVLIANQTYRDRSFQALQTPHADARALAEVLTTRYGFMTSLPSASGQPVSLLLQDASREQMTRTLSMLRKVLQPEDSLFLFFAGHGVKESETDSAYWLPVDAEKDEPQTWVSAGDVQAAIQRLIVRHVLVVADSCFSGEFRRGDPAAAGSDAQGRAQFLGQSMLRASRRFISSGANEPVADGGGRGHSVFARALLDGLRDATEPFTSNELFTRHLVSRVAGKAKQVPQFFPMKEGHDGGDLVFAPRSLP
jgi:uncharacterized caspase-like protein